MHQLFRPLRTRAAVRASEARDHSVVTTDTGRTTMHTDLDTRLRHLRLSGMAAWAFQAYGRAIAELFLPEAPEEEPVEAKFRRLPDAPPLPWSPEMHGLARRIRERQEAALEICEPLEEEPRWEPVGIGYSDDSTVLGERARARLGIDLGEQRSWRDSSGYRPLREWVDAVESPGVFSYAGRDSSREQDARLCFDVRAGSCDCCQH